MPIASNDLHHWLRLTLIPGIGLERQRHLLAAFGLPEHIFSASRHAVAQVIGDKLARALFEHDNQRAIDISLAWASESGNTLITLADAAYPASLLETPDPPTVLYAKGNIGLLQQKSIALVGARNATPQGESNAHAFAKALSQASLTIVSGLALGIDAAAHRGALQGTGSTIAIIGTGIDRIYPAKNAELAREIAEQGLILSEFALGTPAAAYNFPRRNRIISGLSRGVLVVEAALSSGSLITARLAAEQNREVFAIPGSIHSPLSKGCHQLIKQGAKLVDDAKDILDELGWGGAAKPIQTPALAETTPPPEKTADTPEAALLRHMGFDPVDSDTLIARSGLTPEELFAMLLTLELEGQVGRLPGGLFERLH